MKVFLSAPCTQYVAGQHLGTLLDFRVQWTQVIETLEAAGHEVSGARRTEDRGTNRDSPETLLAADLADLDASELVIAYVGSPPSPGVQLELGYAVARRKPFLVFVERGQIEPYLLRGLPAVGHGEIIDIETPADIRVALTERGLGGVR